jgi:hypothetical protein
MSERAIRTIRNPDETHQRFLAARTGVKPGREREEGEQVRRAGARAPVCGRETGGSPLCIGILAGLQRVDVGNSATVAGMMLGGIREQGVVKRCLVEGLQPTAAEIDPEWLHYGSSAARVGGVADRTSGRCRETELPLDGSGEVRCREQSERDQDWRHVRDSSSVG